MEQQGSHDHGHDQELGWDFDSWMYLAGEDVASRDSGRPYTPSSPLTLPFCLSSQTNQKGVRQWFWHCLYIGIIRSPLKKHGHPGTPRPVAAECVGMQAGLGAIDVKPWLSVKDYELACVCIRREGAATSAITHLMIIIPESKRPEREWTRNSRTHRGFINWASKGKGKHAGNSKNTTSAKMKAVIQI